MTFKIVCSKINEIVQLTFDDVNYSTLSESKYCLGLLAKCSKSKNICENCPGKELIGLEINKNA